jgi:hypothetical protein
MCSRSYSSKCLDRKKLGLWTFQRLPLARSNGPAAGCQAYQGHDGLSSQGCLRQHLILFNPSRQPARFRVARSLQHAPFFVFSHARSSDIVIITHPPHIFSHSLHTELHARRHVGSPFSGRQSPATALQKLSPEADAAPDSRSRLLEDNNSLHPRSTCHTVLSPQT